MPSTDRLGGTSLDVSKPQAREEPGRARQRVDGQHVVVPLTAAGQAIHPRHHGEALRHLQNKEAQRANRQVGKHEQEHASDEGAVVPIHADEIDWMSR